MFREGNNMFPKNLLEEAVKIKVDEVLKENDKFCDCEQCRNDVIAIALSNLPPRYAGSEEGKIVLDSIDISSVQTDMDILRVVIEAAEKVNERPHHNR